MRKSVWMMVATVAVLGASLSGQQRVITKIDPFDYDVTPNWSLPYPKANYAWGSVPGIFVESDDRIYIASRGEIPVSNPVPAGYLGFYGSLRPNRL